MDSRPNLRFEFVEMLFALAIGQVGIEVGDLIITNKNIETYPHIYSQLFLGTVVIALSWIGWQNSNSTGNTQVIDSIFSFQFVILLLDIFLVICYFIIVRGAESPNNQQMTIQLDVGIESFWSVVIFSTYFIWDVFTKLLDITLKFDGKRYNKKRKYDFKSFFNRTWQTILCLIFTILVFGYMGEVHDVWDVVLVDMTLVSIFILFRGLKQEIKKEEFIEKEQLAKSKIISLKLTDDKFPITVSENNYKMKIFFSKILPFLFIAAFALMYFCNF